MRIVDDKNRRVLSSVELFLTPQEATQIIGSLEDLLEMEGNNHDHVNDDDYQHEITLEIYTEANFEGFTDVAKKIILEDKL